MFKLLFATVIAFASATYEFKNTCNKFCFRKEYGDYDAASYSKYSATLKQYTTSVEYQQVLAQWQSTVHGDDYYHLKRRSYLSAVEQGCQKIDPDFCLGYFDYSRYWNRLPLAPAYAVAGVKPTNKSYDIVSIEAITTLQYEAVNQGSSKYFNKRHEIYSAIVDAAIDDVNVDFSFQIGVLAQHDKHYSDFQIKLATSKPDNDNSAQYDGLDVYGDCHNQKKVKDLLDVRDNCYGFLLCNKIDTPPANNKITVCETVKGSETTNSSLPHPTQVGNSTIHWPVQNVTSSVGDSIACVIKYVPAQQYTIRQCPLEKYIPPTYVKPIYQPKECPTKILIDQCKGYGVTAADATKYSDNSTDYSSLPGDLGKYADDCHKINQDVYNKVKNSSYSYTPITPDYTQGNYPLTGVAALHSTADGSVPGASSGFKNSAFALLVGVVVIALL